MSTRKTKAAAKRRYHDVRGDGGKFTRRPTTVKIPPVQQQALLAGATPGWWISDHMEELRHFVSWIYVGVHKIAQQWAQAKVCVYDGTMNEDYEKSLRRLPQNVQYLAKMCRNWRVKSNTPDTQNEQETPNFDHPAYKLLDRPNPYTSGRVFRYQVACQLRLTGAAYIWEVPNQFGEPEHLWCLPRAWARPMAPTGPYPEGYYQITPVFNTFTQGIASPSQSTWIIPYSQMIDVKWPNPLYPGEGTSPVTACSQMIDIMEQIDTSTWAGFVNSVKPSLVFNIDPRNGQTITQEMLDRFMAELDSLKAGSNNAGKVLALLGLTVQQMMTGPKDLDYVNGRMQARESVLGSQGVAPIMTGIGGASSYSEAAVQAKCTIEFSVEPDLANYDATLTHRWQTIYGDEFRIEHTAHAYDDPTLQLQKNEQVAAAFQAGVVSANEYRAAIDHEPLNDPIADIPQILLQPVMDPMGGAVEGDDPYSQFDSGGVDLEDDLPDETSTGQKNPLQQQAGGRKMLSRFHLNGYGAMNGKANGSIRE